jgi:hypothetical protein
VPVGDERTAPFLWKCCDAVAIASSNGRAAMAMIVLNYCHRNLKESIMSERLVAMLAKRHLQLSDVELSCLLNVVLEFVEMVGGQ